MTLKLLGTLLILCSTTSAGYYLSVRDKYRIEDLEEMKRLFLILKSEISFSSVPLEEAFREISERVSGPVSMFASYFSQELKKKKGDSAAELWTQSLSKYMNHLYLGKDDFEAFTAFGRALGYLDRQQQLRNIELAELYINQVCVELREKSEKTAKVYRSMGVLTGALIAVILF